jgi:exocyst complex component 3
MAEETTSGAAPRHAREEAEEQQASPSVSSSAFPWQPPSTTSAAASGGGPQHPPWHDATEACKEEARRQFAQLLSRPEDLARLGEMQEAVAAKLHRAQLEVTAGLDAATDGVRAGLEALHAARRSVVDTRDNFANIDALCEEEGSGLANRHELIRDLAVMRVNLSRTIADAEAIMALPEQAAAALATLSDERNLFTCWETLTALARRAAPARVSLEAARRRPHGGGVSRAAAGAYRLLAIVHVFKPHLSCFNIFTATEMTTLI